MDRNNARQIDKSIEWIFQKLRRPTLMWHLASSITIATVGFLSKVITGNFTLFFFFLCKYLNQLSIITHSISKVQFCNAFMCIYVCVCVNKCAKYFCVSYNQD